MMNHKIIALRLLAVVSGMALVVFGFQNCAKGVDPSAYNQVQQSSTNTTPDTPSTPVEEPPPPPAPPGMVNVSVKSVTVKPGNAATIVVQADGTTPADVNFTYSTANGSAQAGTHFVGATNVAGKIPAGSTSAQVQIATSNSGDYFQKSFSVNFTFQSPAVQTSASATVTFDGQAPNAGMYQFTSSYLFKYSQSTSVPGYTLNPSTPIFHVLTSQVSGSQPLYACAFNGGIPFLSLTSNCDGLAFTTQQGVVGYVFSNQQPGTVQVHRYILNFAFRANGIVGWNVSTSASVPNNYEDSGTLGWVYP